MTEQDRLVAVATTQYRHTGVIDISVTARLAALGVDVASLERSIEEQIKTHG